MTQPQIIVGLSGGSGSGKTTILKNLIDCFEPNEICIVSQDNYYKPISEQQVDENGEYNFDLPGAIDIDHFVKDLSDLAQGKSIVKQEYNFNNDNKETVEITVVPAKILLVEGLFIFHFESIRDKLNLKVFVDTDTDKRLQRRIIRDGKERGYGEEMVMYQWKNHVEPAYKNYLKPYKEKCQLVIDNNVSYQQGMNSLKDLILNTLA